MAATGVISLLWLLARHPGDEAVARGRGAEGGGLRLLGEGGDEGPWGEQNGSVGWVGLGFEGMEFVEYSLDELLAATDGFSHDCIVSEHGEEAPNIVYRSRLVSSGRTVAIKRFDCSAWPDSHQFLEEARAVGLLRSGRLSNLIGCCCENGERLLVAEFMPYHTLAKHLCHEETKPLSWAMRVRAALYVAQALEYCASKGRDYHNLNTHKVLFDMDGNPRLSCFGLMKNSRDKTEIITKSFGIILLDLLRKKHIPISNALDLIREEKFMMLMDSCLEGQVFISDITFLMQLTSYYLQNAPHKENPKLLVLGSVLANLQEDVSILLSASGKAYAKADLNEVHGILENDGYKEDEIATFKVSLDSWPDEASESIHVRNQGDIAFRSKEFALAIEQYSRFIDTGAMESPTMLARRSFANAVLGRLEEGLEDARKAEEISPEWPTAHYLQGMVLLKLGQLEGHEKLKIGSAFEYKRSVRTRSV